MAEIIVSLLCGLFILLYGGFTCFTVYMTAIGRADRDSLTFVGKLLWYHGITWMIAAICIVVLSLAIVLAQFIVSAINLKVVIGG